MRHNNKKFGITWTVAMRMKKGIYETPKGLKCKVIKEWAEHFGVSARTIRRELKRFDEHLKSFYNPD